MLYESPHLRVTTGDGVATLWLAFTGSLANALSPARVTELGRAFDSVLDNPHLDALVIRSGLPGGFCGGYVPGTLAGIGSDEDATAFSLVGQRVFDRLAATEMVTLAFVEGPCVGPGLELALACDYRLAVAGPDSVFGFPEAAVGVPPCWGGPTMLRQSLGKRKASKLLGGDETLTAREGQRIGLVDHAFSQRRGKIELRTWLDRIQANPRKRIGFVGRVESSRPAGNAIRGPRRLDPPYEEGLAAERFLFRHALRTANLSAHYVDPNSSVFALNPAPTFPGVVAVEAAHTKIAVEAALRGSQAVVIGSLDHDQRSDLLFADAVRRGRATPLEAEQARSWVRFTNDPTAASTADLVVADARRAAGIRPKPSGVTAVVNGTASNLSRAVEVRFPEPGLAEVHTDLDTHPDAVTALLAWFPRFGFRPVVRQAETDVAATRVAA